MLDVQKLERRWLKYKIKKIAPYFLSFFGVALLSTVIFTWFDHQSQNNQMTIVNKDDNSSPKQPQAKSLSSVKEHATVVLEPSMDFVQNFKSSPSPDESPNQIPTNAPKHPMTTPLPPSKPLEMPKYPQSVKSPSAVTNKNPTNLGSLFINRHESKINIENIKLRFQETSNANLGLFLARYYYDHGEYDEAYNYALKTNSIDSRIDESWIIFSKSLIKLGKIDQAKKTLQLYVTQSNSESAKSLLDSVERGSFK